MTKIKILLLGNSSMLGQHLSIVLKDHKGLRLHTAGRQPTADYQIDITNENNIENIIKNDKPDWVINTIADTNQKTDSVAQYFYTNTIFPQLLHLFAKKYHVKDIHISTNAVLFKTPNIYSTSKKLSENTPYSCIIRTTFVGINQFRNRGLLNWALTSDEPIRGHSKNYWNGISALHLSQSIYQIILNTDFLKIKLPRLIQLASTDKISKLNLIKLFFDNLNIHKSIIRDDSIVNHQLLKPSPYVYKYLKIPTIPRQIIEYANWVKIKNITPFLLK